MLRRLFPVELGGLHELGGFHTWHPLKKVLALLVLLWTWALWIAAFGCAVYWCSAGLM